MAGIAAVSAMTDITAFQQGREARISGKPRDGRRNADWLRGWDMEDENAKAWADDPRNPENQNV